MRHRVRATATAHRLLPRGAHVVVAVSGGADSVALLHVLHALQAERALRLTVAHLHHGIRHESADADAAFVQRLARRLGLPFILGRARVPALAQRRGISLEMAAREARYAFLARALRRAGADCVAVAHTADDQAETILLKLARGAGPQGLGGMPYSAVIHGCPVIRPLLDVARDDVRGYLRRRRIEWREDETNVDRAFLRNRVRLEALPFLERTLNPAFRAALLRTGVILRAENEWLDELSRGALSQCRAEGGALSVGRLRTLPLAAQRRVLRLWLQRQRMPPAALEFEPVERLRAMLASQRSPRNASIAGRVIIVRGDRLMPAPAGRPTGGGFRRVLQVPGATVVSAAGVQVTTALSRGWSPQTGQVPGRYPAAVTVSVRAWRRRKLVLRSWQPGDRMRPLGAGGTRKLQDILTDARVPVGRRRSIPVLECGGEIVWLAGYRIAEGWQLRSQDERALCLRVVPLPAARPTPAREAHHTPQRRVGDGRFPAR